MAPGAYGDLVRKPLSGLRVLDLSRLLPGPFATMVLADLGATVDKVEDPGAGDYLRSMPPQVGREGERLNGAFAMLNRGKRSVVLDLKRPEGRDALRRLVPHYDVLVESFRPGVMTRLGLGYEDLRALHPGLVYCAITGFGQDGPDAQRAGHDIGFIARSGVLGMTGPESGPPQLPGAQLADVGGGALFAVSGILAALHARSTTGEGRLVDVSMTEGAMMLGTLGMMSALGGAPSPAGGGLLTGGLAPYGCYRTRDGRAMALGALEPKFWIAFCTAVGLEPDLQALVPGPHQEAWKAKLTEVFAQRDFGEWRALAAATDCCLEPVLLPEELPDDPQHRARGLFVTTGGGIAPRTPVAATIAPGDAPTQGRDTAAVLREAGWSDDELAALLASSGAR